MKTTAAPVANVRHFFGSNCAPLPHQSIVDYWIPLLSEVADVLEGEKSIGTEPVTSLYVVQIKTVGTYVQC